MTGKEYLNYFNPLSIFAAERTRDIFQVNPTVHDERKDAAEIKVQVFSYSPTHIEEKVFTDTAHVHRYKDSPADTITWINIEGIRKDDVAGVCTHYGVHPLIQEDVLSVGQRPKMDELAPILYCLLNMLYFNEENGTVETEQISIVLGKNYVITFQDDAERDVFTQVREKLRIAGSKLRVSGADYLCYALLDMIVDHYYIVMEKLSERIELLEEKIIRFKSTGSLTEINMLRKELIVLKRNVSPVRDLVNGFLRSDSELLQDKTAKYFKDIYDHIVQANDLAENYRDMMMNLQDLYLSNVNLKMNEVMKVMAVVTCLMAPATVIGGIFGMNFDKLPYIHNQYGFLIAVGLMLLIPAWMIVAFKRRGWF